MDRISLQGFANDSAARARDGLGLRALGILLLAASGALTGCEPISGLHFEFGKNLSPVQARANPTTQNPTGPTEARTSREMPDPRDLDPSHPFPDHPRPDHPRPDHPRPDHPRPDHPRPDIPKPVDFKKPSPAQQGPWKPGFPHDRPDHDRPDHDRPDHDDGYDQSPRPDYPQHPDRPDRPDPFDPYDDSDAARAARVAVRGEALSRCSETSGADLCLGLKYVVYRERGRVQAIPEVEEARILALRNVAEMNRIWESCGIAFQIDEFLTIDPRDYRLKPRVAEFNELDRIRGRLADDRTLLVVTTGNWDRRGSIGNTHANAWTNLPGERYLGAILEARVAQYPNIIAHELGHYLSLGHAEDASNLMHPLVYGHSLEVDSRQCEVARWSVEAYWKKMLREGAGRRAH